MPHSQEDNGGKAHDDDLFKQPSPQEDCEICFSKMPIDATESTYHSCCGKSTCIGCSHHHWMTAASATSVRLCPFCRTPEANSPEDGINRLNKRIEAKDVTAMYTLGYRYFLGEGVRRDCDKAFNMWTTATKMGCTSSHGQLGSMFAEGYGVKEGTDQVDFHWDKAGIHWEKAAMAGDVVARYNLGLLEKQMDRGDGERMGRAMKHFMISAGFGDDKSLKEIRDGYCNGSVEKEDFEKALRAHKESTDEMKTEGRTAAIELRKKWLMRE